MSKASTRLVLVTILAALTGTGAAQAGLDRAQPHELPMLVDPHYELEHPDGPVVGFGQADKLSPRFNGDPVPRRIPDIPMPGGFRARRAGAGRAAADLRRRWRGERAGPAPRRRGPAPSLTFR